jgi:RNA polymerase sigma-70 factor (ECF subfamily)
MSAPERSDDELMAAIARGDRDAFAVLYRRTRPAIYRFALHMTGACASAEDVAQDVFMAVIHDARRYVPGRGGVVPWLLGIARNFARRRSSHDWRLEPLPDDIEGFGADADQLSSMARDRQIEELRTALSRLPVVYREVVVMCDIEELSYADAAAAIGCAIGTVRSRLHRGRALLASRLKRERELAHRPLPGWIV